MLVYKQLPEQGTGNGKDDRVFKRFTKGKYLGSSGLAKVYEFMSIDTKQVVTSKIIPKSLLSKARVHQKIRREIKIHRGLHHSNIVRFKEFLEDDQNLYVILEPCPNQSLKDLLRRRMRLVELEVRYYLIQILSALRYMHEHKVVHRNIHLGNIFLNDKMQTKIGNLSFAAKLEFDSERKRIVCGTPNCIAPEMLEGTGHSYEVDIWSLGVLLYTLLFGTQPFGTDSAQETYRRIKANAYSFPHQITVSADARDLISMILVSDPYERPSIGDMLGHPFLTKNSIPQFLPISTLVLPPSSIYMQQFDKNTADAELIATSRSVLQSRSEESLQRARRATPRDTRGLVWPQRTGSAGSSGSGSESHMERIATTSAYSRVTGGPTIWVKKWVDLSWKYGLGYKLSNGCPGAYFNDKTKIVGDRKGNMFQYEYRSSGENRARVVTHQISHFPKELEKKVGLLKNFRKKLMIGGTSGATVLPLVFVKKWLVTLHAMIFFISNKTVQLYFRDKTELMICSNIKQVVYIDRIGHTMVFPFASLMGSANSAMIKRLRYTKDILAALQRSREDYELASRSTNESLRDYDISE